MVIKPVMFEEVDRFMEEDDTYTNLHSDLHQTVDEYRCLDFGITLKERANAKGIKCALCLLQFGDKRYGIMGSHVMVAIETIDKGIIYYDPQTHNEIVYDIEIGNNLQILFYEAAERKDASYDRYKNYGDDKAFVDAHIIFDKMLIW